MSVAGRVLRVVRVLSYLAPYISLLTVLTDIINISTHGTIFSPSDNQLLSRFCSEWKIQNIHPGFGWTLTSKLVAAKQWSTTTLSCYNLIRSLGCY